jgi:segregation and condensation protein A
VRLAEIILAYLEALVQADSTDWEGLSEFLVLISALLELKSRLLLPGESALEEGLDPDQAQALLVERMIRYRTFKCASAALRERLAENRGRLLRPPAPRRSRRPSIEDLAGTQDPGSLAASLTRLLEQRRGPDTSHITPARVELRRQILAIRRLLGLHSRLSFDEVFGAEEPMTQAVTVFALLELLSEGAIRVSQNEPFGDIVVRARERGRVVA